MANCESLCGGCVNAKIGDNGIPVGCLRRSVSEQAALLVAYASSVKEPLSRDSFCWFRNKTEAQIKAIDDQISKQFKRRSGGYITRLVVVDPEASRRLGRIL